MWTVLEALPLLIWSTICRAVAIGTAKPSVSAEPAAVVRVRRGGGRHHADDVAVGVHQRAAGVARLDVGVGLDQAVQLLRAAVGLVARDDLLVEREHGAGGHRRLAAVAAGVADAHDGVADGQRRGITDAGRRQARRVLQLDEGDVVRRVVADHGRRVGLAVADVRRLDVRRPVDDVVVGQHVAVGGEDDAGRGAAGRRVVVAHRDVDDRRADLGGDRADVGGRRRAARAGPGRRGRAAAVAERGRLLLGRAGRGRLRQRRRRDAGPREVPGDGRAGDEHGRRQRDDRDEAAETAPPASALPAAGGLGSGRGSRRVPGDAAPAGSGHRGVSHG